MSTDTFGTLGVPAHLVNVLARQGITTPTPIQQATLPDSLAGRDVLGRGRTGSGKTLAFLLPVVTRLSADPRPRRSRHPRALILAPTRELASQIDAALAPLAAATNLTSRTVFGGVGQGPQVNALRAGVDVVVACPGRLEDLIGQGHVSLADIEITVLDEADHMADLGFLPGVKRLLDKTPRGSQRMLFSATLDAGIDQLVDRYLVKPVKHEADSAQSPVATMSHHILHVTSDAYLPVLLDLAAAPGRTVVFTRTKHRAKKLARQLNAANVPAVELHGNLSQGARTRSMEAFHGGTAQTLVATDIAARGIHVDDVGLVIHADPPVEHKAYLHRSGRTARAGASGTVITMMTDDQMRDVRDLTRKAGIRATTTKVTQAHPLLRELAPGEREFRAPAAVEESAGDAGRGTSGRSGQARPGHGRGQGRGGQGRGGAPRGDSRSGEGRSGESRGGAGRNGSGRNGAGRGGSRATSAGRAAGSSRDAGQATATAATGRSAGARQASARPRTGGAAAFSAGSRLGRRG